MWENKIHYVYATKQATKTVTVNLDPLKRHLWRVSVFCIPFL